VKILLALILALQLVPAAAAQVDFTQRREVQVFIGEMAKKHKFSRKELRRILADAEFQPSIIKAMNQPAEAPPNSWQSYRALFLSPGRVQAGVEFWNRNAEPLRRAAAEFGVPEEVIVAIIGVETIYGRNLGTYRVIDALATLAFDYPKRAEFFREELENYLVFTRDARLNPLSLKGSYAGAIGIPQFMPGTYRRYAVDYDGDGRANLATSPADAIGSIGNFLRAHGWASGEPAAVAAQVSGEAWRKLADDGVAPVHRADELPAFGVRPAVALQPGTPCALIEFTNPGQPSEFRVGLQNFFVLTRYNRAVFYVGAVLDLAAELARARAG
jgi:membrane-bound lytic murein transglycosylase B